MRNSSSINRHATQNLYLANMANSHLSRLNSDESSGKVTDTSNLQVLAVSDFVQRSSTVNPTSNNRLGRIKKLKKIETKIREDQFISNLKISGSFDEGGGSLHRRMDQHELDMFLLDLPKSSIPTSTTPINDANFGNKLELPKKSKLDDSEVIRGEKVKKKAKSAADKRKLFKSTKTHSITEEPKILINNEELQHSNTRMDEEIIDVLKDHS
jgi:hypothetical protein